MEHQIILDDYQVANLRAVIEAAAPPIKRNPLYVINSGDWMMEIYLKLPKVDYKANKTAEEMAWLASNFI